MKLDTRYKKVLVLGGGKTGCAVLSALFDLMDSGEVFFSADTYDKEGMEPFIKRGLKVLDISEIGETHFDLCIASPGISVFSDLFKTAQKVSSELIGEPEFAWRLSPKRWIGVTGTNGKTTTVTLIHEMLKAAGIPSVLAGNIGNSLTEAVRSKKAEAWVVAELSSYQLATIKNLAPEIGALLTVGEDHITWHKTHEHYVASKEKLFSNMDASSFAVIATKSEEARSIEKRVQARGIPVCEVSLVENPQVAPKAFFEDNALWLQVDEKKELLCKVNELALFGSHNYMNALVAAACAAHAGASIDAIRSVLTTFRGLEHRIEFCGTKDGVTFYNDSKATNVEAAQSAIFALAEKHPICLFGGVDKESDLVQFASSIAGIIKAAVCFGPAQTRFANALEEAGVHVLVAPHLKEAFFGAVALAQNDDTILLSPACASFDEFASFEERGTYFKNLVKELT